MSRIATARNLAAEIRAAIDLMPYHHGQEIIRAYDMTMGLVVALERGWVAQVSAEGMVELTELHDLLNRPELAEARALAETVQEDDLLEITDYETRQRVRVQVAVRMPIPYGVKVVYMDGPHRGQTDTINLFWGHYQAAKLEA